MLPNQCVGMRRGPSWLEEGASTSLGAGVGGFRREESPRRVRARAREGASRRGPRGWSGGMLGTGQSQGRGPLGAGEGEMREGASRVGARRVWQGDCVREGDFDGEGSLSSRHAPPHLEYGDADVVLRGTIDGQPALRALPPECSSFCCAGMQNAAPMYLHRLGPVMLPS